MVLEEELDYEPSKGDNDYESDEEDFQGTSQEESTKHNAEISVTPGLNVSVGMVKNVTNE